MNNAHILAQKKLIVFVSFCLTSFTEVAQYSAPVDYDRVASQDGKGKMGSNDTLQNGGLSYFVDSYELLTFNDNKIFDKYNVQGKRQEFIQKFGANTDD